MSIETVKKTAFFRRKEEKKEIQEQMRGVPKILCIVAAFIAYVMVLGFTFELAGPIFGFSFLAITLLITGFLGKQSRTAPKTEKNIVTRIKEKYPLALQTGIAVSPGVVALFVPSSIAGPVVFAVLVAAIIVGNAVEFFF
jgi:hypothetical protein